VPEPENNKKFFFHTAIDNCAGVSATVPPVACGQMNLLDEQITYGVSPIEENGPRHLDVQRPAALC